MWSTGCSLLWADQTNQNRHRRSLSTTTDVSELSIEEKMATIYNKVILQHDNTRPHIAKWVKTYFETVKWQVLTHPPYWPDITLSNYQLYRSMAHGLTEQHFHSYEDAKKRVNSWLASKDMLIFQCGIQMLLERWEKVVASRRTIFSVTYYLLIFENKHYFPWKISKNLFKVPIIVDYNC